MGLFDSRAGDKIRDQIAALLDFQSDDDRNLLFCMIGLGAAAPIAIFNKGAAAGSPFTNPFTAPADDALAATAYTNSQIGPINPLNAFPWVSGATARQIRLLGLQLIQSTATGLTANDTNFATIQINHLTSAFASPTVGISQATTITGGGTGNWTATAGAKVNILPAATTGQIAVANGVLGYAHTKTGTGVIVPGFTGYVYGAPA